MTIEEIFSSKGRVRILKILAECEELNISEIVRRSELNYATASKHLDALMRAGLIREKRFGRIRIFRFDGENQRAKAVRELLFTWSREEDL